MSTDRYEIIDEGSQIRILYSGSISTIISGPMGTHIEDAVIGAIRQQTRDLEQLRAELAAAVAAVELDALLKAWAAKHLPSGYCKCVGKSRRLTVTAEDVAEYSRPGLEQAKARLAAIDRAPRLFTADNMFDAHEDGATHRSEWQRSDTFKLVQERAKWNR